MSEVKSWTVQISGTLVTLHGPKGLKLGHHVVLKSDFDTVVKERDDLRAEMRALKDELDRTTDALIHQGKTLRKTTENLLKMSNNKDAEIQRLREALDLAKSISDTVVNPAMTRSTIDMKRALDTVYEICKKALQSEPGKGEGEG